MIRLLLLVTLGGLIYWFWKWTMARYERLKSNLQFRRSGAAADHPARASELVQDPVCKLYISKDTAVSHNGHFFCSEKCKAEYKK